MRRKVLGEVQSHVQGHDRRRQGIYPSNTHPKSIHQLVSVSAAHRPARRTAPHTQSPTPPPTRKPTRTPSRAPTSKPSLSPTISPTPVSDPRVNPIWAKVPPCVHTVCKLVCRRAHGDISSAMRPSVHASAHPRNHALMHSRIHATAHPRNHAAVYDCNRSRYASPQHMHPCNYAAPPVRDFFCLFASYDSSVCLRRHGCLRTPFPVHQGHG